MVHSLRVSRLLLLIIAAAVALRLLYVVVAGQTLSLQASGYDVYAVNLLAGHGYTRFADLHPDSDLPPLYSFFLAGVYTLFGRSPLPVALVQIGCDVVTLLAIAAIGRRIGGERVGLLAAALTGFYPYLLFQDLSANDTALFIMLLALGIWGVYRACETRALRWAIFVGLTFGVAALTKSLVILMLPLIGWWWWRQVGLRRAVLLVGALLVVSAAVLLPWIVRNTRLQGTLTFVSTNDGSNLYQGNNSCVADYLLAGWDAQWVDCLTPTPPGLSETEESAWFRDQALIYVRDHLDAMPRLLAVKFITLWSPELLPRAVPPAANLGDVAVLQYEQPLFQVARALHLLYFTPLLLLAVVGLLRAGRVRQLAGKYAPLWIVFVGITAAYLIYHPSTRYRSPADPFLFVLSAETLLWLWGRVAGRGIWPGGRDAQDTRDAQGE